MHKLKVFVRVFLSVICLFFIGAHSQAEYYVYKHKDGTTWYTDKKTRTKTFNLCMAKSKKWNAYITYYWHYCPNIL